MMKEIKNGAFTYNNEPYNFDFNTSLSAYEKQIFVRKVVRNLVDKEGYDFVLKDLIFDFVIVEMFTNIDTSFVNMKDDNGEDINPIILVEHFLEATNVADIVKANMEDGLLEELIHAVDLDIQYLTGINTNPLSDSIAKLVSTIEKKIGELDLDSMTDMAKKLASMSGDFTVENVVNAYMNSDVHKENLMQIEESKK